MPQCWLSGQAAGTAAAVAANKGVLPSKIDVRLVQRELLKQGAYLSPSIENGLAMPDAAE